MAIDKAVDSAVLDAGLATVATAIRTKGGTSAQLSFPAGMAQAIADLPNTYAAADEGKVVSSGALVAQTSTTITENGTVDTTLNNSVTVTVQASGNGTIWLTQDTDEMPLTVKVVGVTTIPKYMFGSFGPGGQGANIYKKTTQIELPSGITSIGDWAFYGCEALATTSLPSGITSIGYNAFYGCGNIALTSLPSGITSIGQGAFNGCASMVLTSLPSGLTIIESTAFAGCQGLALTNLPSSVTSIGDSAFESCANLALTSLPNGLTSIGNNAFYGCLRLALTSLPSGITSINSSAFRNCTSLTEMTFKGDITSVGARAFQGCPNILKYDFTNNTAVPTIANVNAFQDINADCKIIVPDSLYNEWKSTPGWAYRASYIVAESEYTA